MQTKYDVGEKVLLKVEIKNINIDYKGMIKYRIAFRDSAGDIASALVTEPQLKACLAVEK